MTLVAEKEKTILSNMDIDYEEESEDGVNRIVHFNKTPVMSTYLVAFAVGEYDHVEATTTDGVRVRVYTPRGKSAQVMIMKQLNPNQYNIINLESSHISTLLWPLC